ncbi:MAG: transglutaminase domain-containing protein [Ruminococcus sp.]|nr:transglutaminase domain-containing protein [Ruminococcus sp.]
MKETNKKPAERLAAIFFDPILLYAALMVMAIMYHYHSSMTFVYGLVTLAAGAVLFRLFDFMQKHNLIGGVIYVAVFAGAMWLSGQCAEIGHLNYPLSWLVWFLTPQDAMDFNLWYTFSVYIFFVMFMMSVVYYFTRVRYRLFMNFLIVMVPFELYGKEYEKMPTLFIILIAVGYILLMVRYRTLSENGGVKVIEHTETWKTVAAYAVVFAVAAAVVPKPEVEADRTYLEQLIDADRYTDRLIAMLNVFRDTTSNDNFRNNNSEVPVYFVSAQEPLRLKTASYSEYSMTTDSWTARDSDSRYISRYTSYPVEMFPVGSVLEAVSEAAYRSDDFAEEYDISDIAEFMIDYPEQREMTIRGVSSEAQFAPAPQFAVSLDDSTSDEEIALINSGLIYCTDGYFKSTDTFTFTYSADEFFSDRENRTAAEALCREDYGDILEDALEVLNEEYDSSPKKDRDHLGTLCRALDRDIKYRTDYSGVLLNYYGSERIRALAEEITQDCGTDYEKAKAIESWFYSSGFSYDPAYVKGSNANAETFLFESRRGVCYEYATAMVLMARSVGIPARFCEGYNMSREYKNERLGTNMVVMVADAHAYPELYIRGAGWMSFEPTVTDYIPQQTTGTATKLLTRAGAVMFAMAVLLLLGILLYPIISHKVFLMLMRHREPGRTVRSAMHRLCRLYGIERGNTSREAAQAVAAFSGADILPLAVLFDKAEYGGAALTSEERDAAVQIYEAAFTAYRQNRRKKRRATNSGALTQK